MALAAPLPVVGAGMGRRTPLMAAAAEGSVDVLAQLLENGAQMLEIDDLGMCALSFSAAHGHTDAAKALCVRGANVNTTDKRGRTPLMHAVLGGHLDTSVQLALIGADISQQDDGCCSALDHAIDIPNRAIALALLLIATGKFSRPLGHLLTLPRLQQLHTWVRDKQGKNHGAMGTVLHQYAACLAPAAGQAAPPASAEQRAECAGGVLAVLLWASQHALAPLAQQAAAHLSSLAADELCGLQDEAGRGVLHILVLAGRGETCRALTQALPRAEAAKLLTRRDGAGRLPHEISEAEMPAQAMAAIRAARRDVEALWRDVDRAAGGAASAAAERARSACTSPMAGAALQGRASEAPSSPGSARPGRGGAVRRRSGSHTTLHTLASHPAIPASSSVDQLRETAQTVAAADDLMQLCAAPCARAPRPRGTKPYQRPGKRGSGSQGKECWLPGGLWWEDPRGAAAIPAGRQPGELQGWDPLGAERTQQNRVEQKQLLLEKEEAVQDLESRDDAVAFCHRLKASCSNHEHSATSALATLAAPITETVDDSVLDKSSQFKRLAAWGGFRRQFVQDEVQEDGHPAPTAQKQGKAPAEPAPRTALPAGAPSFAAAPAAAAQPAFGAAVDPQLFAPLQQRLYAKKAEVLAARQALAQLLEEERQLTAQLMALAMGTPQPMDR